MRLLHFCGFDAVSVFYRALEAFEDLNCRLLHSTIAHFVEHICKGYGSVSHDLRFGKSDLLWSFCLNTFFSIIGGPIQLLQVFASNANFAGILNPLGSLPGTGGSWQKSPHSMS
jgi:hypothetical protein